MFVCISFVVFPMLPPWYVPLSSQPRPYHKSNTGKHGGKKTSVWKVYIHELLIWWFHMCCFWHLLFTALAVCKPPSAGLAPWRTKCFKEAVRCLPAKISSGCHLSTKSERIYFGFVAPWTVFLYQAKTSAKHGGVMRTKTRCTSEASWSIPDSNTGGCEVRSAWCARS